MCGIYVHVPFCKRKCNYCDFCSFPNSSEEEMERYVDAVIREISSYRSEKPIKADTVFFGGGTPSLLSVSQFRKICDALRKTFDLSKLCEFSVEVNPKTASLEKIREYVSCGVNRISIGLQSKHEKEQKMLGRIHNYDDFLECVNLARSCGVSNINADIMYGIPYQTKESFIETLHSVIELDIPHISLYGLMIEEGTPFGNTVESLPLPGEDDECDMYFLAASELSKHGYLHYEISNYAKPPLSCKHNLKYWHAEEYIGIGPSASSYFGGKRYTNTRDLTEYFSDEYKEYRQTEPVLTEDRVTEFVMLALRLSCGFSLSEFHEKFGFDFLQGRAQILEKYSSRGYLKVEDGRIFLTEKGFYISNTIIAELL